MHIILVGINHRTASVDVRERLAFDSQLIPKALSELKEEFPSCEFLILSTCNRVECYAAVPKNDGLGPRDLAKRLCQIRDVDFENVEQYLSIKMNEDAVSHIFTVTSSLDSMVIGESQVTAQVKASYKLACENESSGKILHRLFHDAFRTAKDVISNTSIANRRVSVAGVAVELAKRLFVDIASAKVVVVGAGQMGELLVDHFQQEKCNDVTVVNRSKKRMCLLAEKHGIVSKSWESLDQEIVKADILVSSVSSDEGYLFGKETIDPIMSRRDGRDLLVIDIAVPRSFEPELNGLSDLHLYSIDDLSEIAQDNIKMREGDLEQAVEIVCANVSEFMDWFITRDVGPMIGKVKGAFDQILEMEMENFFAGEHQRTYDRELLEASMGRVVNKLCHCVIKNIDTISKEIGADGAERLANSILENAQEIISENSARKKSQ